MPVENSSVSETPHNFDFARISKISVFQGKIEGLLVYNIAKSLNIDTV